MDYLLLSIVALNFLGVLYIVIKVSIRPQKVPKDQTQQQMNQKLIEQMIKIKQETSELKVSIQQHNQMIIGELTKLREEKTQLEVKPDNSHKETLFLNDRYQEIFDLDRKGLSIEEIAKKLEKGYGEVDFILQLAGKDFTQKGDKQ